jgi:hypothetical protein
MYLVSGDESVALIDGRRQPLDQDAALVELSDGDILRISARRCAETMDMSLQMGVRV